MVVVVLRVFDVGVHDAGGVVAALVGVFEVVPAVHASHAAFVAFDGERVAVVEGEGGGAYFVVADGNVGDVSASENFCVFFCRAVLVEGEGGGVHGWFLLFLVCWLLCPRVVGVVRLVWALLVVVEVAAAGFAIAGAGAFAVGALAVPVCGAAVACCLVHSSYCIICTRVCLHVWTRGWLVVGWLVVGWLVVGWLVVPRAAGCLSVSARDGWRGWPRAQCFLCLCPSWWRVVCGCVLGYLRLRGEFLFVRASATWVACGVWVCSWLSGFWWVWDVEGVAFAQELFGF